MQQLGFRSTVTADVFRRMAMELKVVERQIELEMRQYRGKAAVACPVPPTNLDYRRLLDQRASLRRAMGLR